MNNAGTAIAGPLEYVDIDEFRRLFEVNVFGQLAVTQGALHRHPKSAYVVGGEARLAVALSKVLPSRTFDAVLDQQTR